MKRVADSEKQWKPRRPIILRAGASHSQCGGAKSNNSHAKNNSSSAVTSSASYLYSKSKQAQMQAAAQIDASCDIASLLNWPCSESSNEENKNSSPMPPASDNCPASGGGSQNCEVIRTSPTSFILTPRNDNLSHQEPIKKEDKGSRSGKKPSKRKVQFEVTVLTGIVNSFSFPKLGEVSQNSGAVPPSPTPKIKVENSSPPSGWPQNCDVIRTSPTHFTLAPRNANILPQDSNREEVQGSGSGEPSNLNEQFKVKVVIEPEPQQPSPQERIVVKQEFLGDTGAATPMRTEATTPTGTGGETTETTIASTTSNVSVDNSTSSASTSTANLIYIDDASIRQLEPAKLTTGGSGILVTFSNDPNIVYCLAPATSTGSIAPSNMYIPLPQGTMKIVGAVSAVPLVAGGLPMISEPVTAFLPGEVPQVPELPLPILRSEGIPTPTESDIVWVNPKQYHRILKRREARAKLDARFPFHRSKYMHESRHLHAAGRTRGYGGQFMGGAKKD